jgi:hypothetical protein
MHKSNLLRGASSHIEAAKGNRGRAGSKLFHEYIIKTHNTQLFRYRLAFA